MVLHHSTALGKPLQFLYSTSVINIASSHCLSNEVHFKFCVLPYKMECFKYTVGVLYE